MIKKIITTIIFAISPMAHAAEYTIYAHGIVSGPEQAKRFQDAFATPQLIALEFLDSRPASGIGLNKAINKITNLMGKKVNRNAMFMGQGLDLETIDQAVRSVSPSESIILYGCSRGAAAILTYMGQHNPSNIAAIVLDACPAHIAQTTEPLLARLGINPKRADDIFSILFPQYNPRSALSPEDAIEKIKNKSVPILLIHSLTDTVVHYTHSIRLYQKFLQAGFTSVHLVCSPQGRHSYMLQDSETQEIYLQAVHSFYKKYDLNYDAAWAQDHCAPSNIDLKTAHQMIEAYRQNIQDCYLQALKRNTKISCGAMLMLGCGMYLLPKSLDTISSKIWK